MIYYLAALLLTVLHCETNAATSTITNVSTPVVHSPVSDQATWGKITQYSEAELNALSDILKMDLLTPLPEINAQDLEALAKKGSNEVSHVEGPCTIANVEITQGQTHLEGNQPLLLIKGKYKGNGVFEFKYSRPGEEHQNGKTVKIKATNLVVNDHVKDTTLGRFLQNYLNGLTHASTSHIVTEQAPPPQTRTIIVHDQAPPPPVVYSSPPVVYAPAPVYVAPAPVIVGVGPWGYGHRRYYR